MSIIVDQVTIATGREFRSKILSKDECDKINKELKKIGEYLYAEEVEYILNFYYNKKLRFIHDSGHSLLDIFVGSEPWTLLVFEEM